MGLRALNNPAASFEDPYASTGLDAVPPAPLPFSASGGIISEYTDPGGTYRAHVFTASGSLVVASGVESATVEYFVLGGGGGGIAASVCCGTTTLSVALSGFECVESSVHDLMKE